MSRRNVAQIAVFIGFCQYFGLNIVFSFISALRRTGYNTKSQKIHAEKDRKQEKKVEMVRFSKTS